MFVHAALAKGRDRFTVSSAAQWRARASTRYEGAIVREVVADQDEALEPLNSLRQIMLEADALVLRLVPNLVLYLDAVLEYFIHR